MKEKAVHGNGFRTANVSRVAVGGQLLGDKDARFLRVFLKLLVRAIGGD